MRVRGGTTLRRSLSERRGLAPLELVLWLPILLMVAALFVNFGTMAAWRLRGEVVARDAAWRTQWPHSGDHEPRPDVWPSNAGIGVGGASQIGLLDDPALNLPVVRGPLPNRFVVNQVLNPLQGMHQGEASISRRFPLLSNLTLYRGLDRDSPDQRQWKGRYDSGLIRHPLLDRQWQVQQMGHWNGSRRTQVLYQLPQTDQGLPQAFISAFLELLHIPHFDALRVLDNDDDWKRYADWPYPTGARDFHPRVNSRFCEMDPQIVYDTQVAPPRNPLVDITDEQGDIISGRITKLPWTMTEAFLSMYNRAKSRMEQMIELLDGQLRATPPPPPQDAADIQRQIDAISSEIEYVDSQIELLEAELARLGTRPR